MSKKLLLYLCPYLIDYMMMLTPGNSKTKNRTVKDFLTQLSDVLSPKLENYIKFIYRFTPPHIGNIVNVNIPSIWTSIPITNTKEFLEECQRHMETINEITQHAYIMELEREILIYVPCLSKIISITGFIHNIRRYGNRINHEDNPDNLPPYTISFEDCPFDELSESNRLSFFKCIDKSQDLSDVWGQQLWYLEYLKYRAQIMKSLHEEIFFAPIPPLKYRVRFQEAQTDFKSYLQCQGN